MDVSIRDFAGDMCKPKGGPIGYYISLVTSSSTFVGRRRQSKIRRKGAEGEGRKVDSSGTKERSGGWKIKSCTNSVTYLHVLQGILLSNAAQNTFLAALLELASQQQLVENVISFREREDDIKLANVAIVLIHLFDVSMDNLEGDKLVVFGGATGDEEERGVSAVHDFGVCSTSVQFPFSAGSGIS